jgi:RHS repeat-associated protein
MDADVVVYFKSGAQGTATITLTASGNASDDGSYDLSVGPPVGAPIVDLTPYNFDNQDYGRCAQACFAATYAQATVPYYSMDVARNVQLVYNGDRVHPKPFVFANVSPDLSHAGSPSEYNLQVKINGSFVTCMNGEQTLRFSYPGTSPARLGCQFDASGYATNVYPMDIIVSAKYGDSLLANDVTTKFVAVNDSASAIARGWTLAGIEKLYIQGDGSALVTTGGGTALYYSKWGNLFTPPPGVFGQLITSNLSGTSGWARVFPDSTKVVFDNTGKMVQLRDAFNNVDTIKYDAGGRVSKIMDPLGLAITLGYGTNGLSSISDPGSPARVTNVTVDANHSLTAIQDPDAISTTFGYDTSLRLSTISNRSGKTTTLTYDSQAGTLASVAGPTIPLFDGSSNAPTVTLATWQKQGVPYATTSGTPATAPMADSVRATLTEPGGALMRFTVNRWGSPARTTDPLSRLTVVNYDANGLPVRVGYPSGAVDSATYNASGLPTFIQTADTTSRQFITYNSGWGKPDSAWGGPRAPMKAWINQTANGRVDSVRVASRDKTRYTYSTTGRVTSVKDPNGHVIMKHWFTGTNANTSQDSVPGGAITLYYYDAYGRDTAVKGPLTPLRRIHFDVVNHAVQSYDGVYTSPTMVSYDSMGNTKSVTDAKGQVYGFSYNALGWLIAKTDPAGVSDTFKYNANGDLMRWKNRRGQTISFTYDIVHRQLTKSGVNTDTDSWGYSLDGRIDTSTSPIATEITYRNVRRQPDSVKTLLGGQTFWRRYHFNKWGIEDTVGISGGGVAFRSRVYTIDTTRFLLGGVRLGPPSAGATSVSHDVSANTTTLTYRGAPVTLQYDTRNQLGSVTSSAAFGDSVLRMILYDEEGRLVRQADKAGTSAVKYTYDGLGRLTSDTDQVRNSPPSDCDGYPPPIIGDNGSNCLESINWQNLGGESFSYDSVGNRVDHSGSYGTGNRIQLFAGCSYLTDSDGNVTSRRCPGDTVVFKWSAEGLLDTVITSARTLRYYYDANERLVRKDSAGQASRYFLWEGRNLLSELDGSATSERAEFSYLTGLDNPHAIVFGGIEYDAHKDGTRSVVALTDSVQSLARSYELDSWGNLQHSEGGVSFNNADRMRFKGALFLGEEANLYYMRARWYEPKTGRFLSEDPVGISGGLNQYAYSHNDPVNYSDPSGLCPQGATLQSEKLLTNESGELWGAQTCQDASGNLFAWWEQYTMAPVTVIGYADPGFWDTPTLVSGFADWLTNMDQSPLNLDQPQNGLFCPLLTCSRPEVTPREMVRCGIAEAWTLANVYADISLVGEMKLYLNHAITMAELMLKTIRESVALGTLETITKTQTLPSFSEVIDDAAGGFIPGYGTSKAIQDQRAACARPSNS